VSIDYSRFNPLIWGRTSATAMLSPSAAWFIEIGGGASHWDGDLRNIQVGAIEVRGASARLTCGYPGRPEQCRSAYPSV
jgi:hypothetical protein